MKTISRISIASGTAVLCLGVAGPALACVVPTDSSPATAPATAHWTGVTTQTTLSAAIAQADASIAAKQAQLNQAATKIAADPTLTAAQRATVLADINAALGGLSTLKAQVDAATTTATLSADLKMAHSSATSDPLALAGALSKADTQIAKDEAQLTAWAAKIGADSKLTAAQQAQLTSWIAAKQAALQALQAKLDAATSLSEVNADLHSSALVHNRPQLTAFGHQAKHAAKDPGAKAAVTTATKSSDKSDPRSSRCSHGPGSTAAGGSAASTVVLTAAKTAGHSGSAHSANRSVPHSTPRTAHAGRHGQHGR